MIILCFMFFHVMMARLSTSLTPGLALTRPSTVGYSSSPIGKTLSCVILALFLDVLMITFFIILFTF